MKREYKALVMAGGIGGLTLGLQRAKARFRGVEGTFRVIASVDIDPSANRDHERLTGVRATTADCHVMTPAELRAACRGENPDLVAMSPPCTGFSGLLGEAKSKTEKYQALNRLVPEICFLVCETFKDDLPAFLLIENVPRIQQRGAELLDQVQKVLEGYGYVCSRTTHDCGELGGMGQHRPRFLMVARLARKMPNFVYQPPKLPLKTIGDVIGNLPLPGDPSCGPMHRLPKLQTKTWARLALIPAGGDWRDLPGMEGKPDYKTYGIVPFDETCAPITAKAGPGSGPFSVADPRWGGYGVRDFDDQAPTITSARAPGQGDFSVADPRLKLGEHSTKMRVESFDEPSKTVTGSDRVGSGAPSVADPRWNRGALGVKRFDEPAGVVTGGGRPGQGAFSVADPRGRRFNNVMRVVRFDETSVAVTGGATPTSGGVNVADPRLGCKQRNGSHGVQSWDEPSTAIVGRMKHDNSPGSVADPRALLAAMLHDETQPDPPPLIIAEDGTWHRPLTTFELAALQTLPLWFPDGSPLVLDGMSQSGWRMHIGNLVPPDAATAIGRVVLHALLVAASGAWALSSEEIWVLPEARLEA